MSLLDQANDPRRLVAHDDDSVVHSCTYPCATLLGGIPWWIQSDLLSYPLHSLEGQSRPWGVCITPASGGEELHLYSSQVIKDLGGPDPSSLTGSVISRERIAASWCTWLSHAPTVESEEVGRSGPPSVRSIKRLVQFSRKPLSCAAPSWHHRWTRPGIRWIRRTKPNSLINRLVEYLRPIVLRHRLATLA